MTPGLYALLGAVLFGALMRLHGNKADHTVESIRGLVGNCPGQLGAVLRRLRSSGDPALGQAIRVRMGDVECGIGNLGSTSEQLDSGCIGEEQGAQAQTCGLKGWDRSIHK